MQTDFEREKSKYSEIWTHGEYRRNSPAELLLKKWDQVRMDESILWVSDYGCGTGRALPELRRLFPNARIAQIDIAENCRDEDMHADVFYQACLWDLDKYKIPPADFGICIDLIEHIPPHYIEETLWQLAQNCDRLLLQGSMQQESHGKLIGQTLHLTVQPWHWWETMIDRHFKPAIEPVVGEFSFKGIWMPR